MVKVVCCKPLPVPFKPFFKSNHSVARIITYNKRERVEGEPTRGQLIGMELGAIVVGLFLAFVLKGTDPVCRLQDTCFSGCASDSGEECKGMPDERAANMSTYFYNDTKNSDTWKNCHNASLEWEKGPKV